MRSGLVVANRSKSQGEAGSAELGMIVIHQFADSRASEPLKFFEPLQLHLQPPAYFRS
jgi:hypothetical protein